jgi:chromosome segregation ATPase
MNDWYIITFPALFGVAGFVYGAWQQQNARANALLTTAKDFAALREVHEGDVAQLVIAEEEIERLTDQRDQAYAQRERMQQELHKADKAIEKFIDEIASLKAEVNILVQERGKVDGVPQTVVATNNTKPGRTHKRQGATPASNRGDTTKRTPSE